MKLSIRTADGKEQIVDIDAKGLKVAAQPGATYKVVETASGKTPRTAQVKRVHDDLVIEGGAADPGRVELQGFFNDCTPSDRCWAVLDTPTTAAAGSTTTAGASEVVITQDGHTLGLLGAGQSGGMTDGQVLAFAMNTDGGGFGGTGALVGGLVALGIAGGGGGEGGGGSTAAPAAVDTPKPLTIKGSVAAGLVKAGTVDVLVYDKDGNLLGHALVSNDHGNYEITLPNKGGYSGPLLLVAKDVTPGVDDNYVDEATGNLTGLALHLAAVGVSPGTLSTVIINITPLTQLAALKMGVDVNAVGAQMRPPSDIAAINTVNHAVSEFFGIADVLGNVVTINDSGFRGADAASSAYGVALARLSEMDGRFGGSMSLTLNHLAGVLWLENGVLTSSEAGLFTIDTSRTIPTEADSLAAAAASSASHLAAVNLANLDAARFVIALPVNAVAGDRVLITLTGPNGTATLTPYIVTAADLAHGYAAVPMDAAALAAAGSGSIVPSAIVTDAAGANASAALVLASFTADVVAPAPVIALQAGEDGTLGAAATSLGVDVSYAGMKAGDVVQMKVGGVAVGSPHTVTAAEASAGHLALTLARSDLGADGAHALTATVTDGAGNHGTTAQALNVTLDTAAPAPTIWLEPGHDELVTANETHVAIGVGYDDMEEGDVVQVHVAGVPTGDAHVVTAQEAVTHTLRLFVARTSLGGDGLRHVSVAVTDDSGNTGGSGTVALTVDSTVTTPVPTLSVALQPGEDGSLNGHDSAVQITVQFDHAAAGDVVQLQVAGSPVGVPHVITATEQLAGQLVLTLPRTDLGADGLKNVTVVATTASGLNGSSGTLNLSLDTTAPAPALAIASGEDAQLNANDSGVHLDIGYAGMQAGDVVQLKLAGADLGTPYTVTSADVTAGHATVAIALNDLGADGTKNVSAVVTDAAGNAGTSAAVALQLATGRPSLTLAAGDDTHLNAQDSGAHVEVAYAGMQAGDTIQLQLGGGALGAAYTVTAADVSAGHASLLVASSALGGDGSKAVSAVVTAGGGMPIASAPLTLQLDTTAPAPVLTVSAGDDAWLNAAETGVHLDLSATGLQAGDTVQLKLGGADLGVPYTVTAADVTAGHATLLVPASALGADGSKSITALVTDAAGNSGTSAPLALQLDTSAPAPVLSIAAGENALLNAAETSVHLDVGYAGMQAGDLVQVKLSGNNLGAAYTVTAADVLAGHALLTVAAGSLGADGIKNLGVVVSDAAGNAGTGGPLLLTLDTVSPTPGLVLASGHDAFINAAETSVQVDIGYTGLRAGDTIQLKLAGNDLGSAYVVTALDVTNGHANLGIARSALGADGGKAVTALVTDTAGNTGTSATLALTLDTVTPTPTLAVAAGQDAVLNAAESSVTIELQSGSLQAGETVQLMLGGQALGGLYTVTAADVLAGHASLQVAASALGADGAKAITATVTDAAGNTGTSAALALSLDTTAPALQFSNGSGALLTGAGLGALGGGHAGVALVDAASSVSDGSSAAVAHLRLDLSGFVDGASEKLGLGGSTLNGDGSSAPTTVSAAGLGWNVAFDGDAYVFTPVSGSASAAQVAALMQVSYNDLAGTITDGQRVVGFTATDAAGNVGNTVTSSVLVATTPPALVPAITALSNDTGIAGDFHTTGAAQAVSGTYSGIANAGDRIQVSLDNATWVDATIVDATHWTVNGITLATGTHTLYVRAIDLSGNATAPATQGYTLDASSIATVATLAGASESDATHGSLTGSFASGTSTDGHLPLLSGNLDTPLAANQVVAVYDTVNGVTTRLGEANVSGMGWSFTTPALAIGSHGLQAVVENPASGATGSRSAVFTVNEQSITLLATDDVGGAQGVLGNHAVTDDNVPHLSGSLGSATLAAGEVVGIYNGSSFLGNATVTGNTWTFTLPSSLGNGAHALVAMIQDGNGASASTGRVVSGTLNLTVDTSGLPPVQTVTIDQVGDSNGSRGSFTGAMSGGTSTDDRTPALSGSLSGTLGASETVAIYDTVNGVATRLGTATVNGLGWTFNSPSLALGSHSLSAVVENAANGLQGTPSAGFVLVEQSVQINSLADDVGINIGLLTDVGLTDDNLPTLAGSLGSATLGGNEVVAIYDTLNGVTTKIGTATVTGTGWTFTPGTPLGDGAHTLRALVEDTNGTVNDGRAVSNDYHITVVTPLGAPTHAVTISAAVDNDATNVSATGGIASGHSTDDRTPTLNGTLNATLGIGETLAVYDGSTRLGDATVTGTSWSFTTPSLGLGSHSLTARVENVVTGANGSSSAAFVVIEQSVSAGTLADDVGATQGTVAAGGVTDDNRPSFSGTLGTATLGSGEVVAIYDGSTKLGNATISGTGWSFTPGSALADGSHSLRAVLQDGASSNAATGVAIGATNSFTVNTSAVVPTQTVSIVSATEAATTNGSVSGSFTSGTSTDGNLPTLSGNLSGTLDAGQALVVYDGATRLGTASVTGTSWSFTTPWLATGSHSLTALVENQASGAQGPASAPFQVIEQTIAIDSFLGLTGAIQLLVGNLLSVVVGSTPTFTGTLGTPTLGSGEVIALYDGSTKLGNATVSGTTWSFTPGSSLSTGFHHISAVIQDGSTIGVNSGRVVAVAHDLTVDISLLVPTQTVSISAAADNLAVNGSVTGSLLSGSTTDDDTPTLSGTLSLPLTGSQVVGVYDGATKLGNAVVNGSGWTFTSPSLAAGTHHLTAKVENPVTGSSGTASLAFDVNVQSLGAVTISDNVGTIQGTIASGGVSDDKTPTLSGTLGTSSFGLLDVVAVYDTVNGVTAKLGNATVNGSSWSFTPLLPLADGAHSFSAVVQSSLALNSAGSVVSAPVALTIDSSSAPTQLVGISAALDALGSGASKIGAVLSGGTTDDGAPVLSGSLNVSLSGAQVVGVYDTIGGVKTRLGDATINPGDLLHWSFTPSVALAAGTHTLTARVENTATGSQGTESLGFTLTERPIALHVMDNAGALQGDVLQFAQPVTNDTTLALSGTIGTALGLLGGLLEKVAVYDNGSLVGDATVSGTNWSFNLNGLSLGSHDLSVRITDFLHNGYTVATGATITVAASDLPATTQDASYSTAAVNKLTLAGSSSTLDLTAVSGGAQPQLDVIDVGASGNGVKLALADVLQGSVNVFNAASGWSGLATLGGSGKHQVVVDSSTGSGSGSVNLTDGSWTSLGTTTHAGHTYTVYEDSTHLAQLLVESHLSRSGVI